MKLKKVVFVLPSLITFSSVFASFYAIILAFDPIKENSIYLASIAIFYAMIFDGLDGRVARMTKTSSDFGMQLDSLADAVSFGVAPAILIYKWGLSSLGMIGMLIAFIYVVAGISRLAKFNVMAINGTGNKNYFSGMPIPLAAGLLIGIIMSYYQLKGFNKMLDNDKIQSPDYWIYALSVFVLIISFLMVSNVPFKTFKHIKFNRNVVAIILLIFISIAIVFVNFTPAFTLMSFSMIYVVYNLLEGAVKFRIRKYHPALLKDPEYLKKELLEDEYVGDKLDEEVLFNKENSKIEEKPKVEKKED